jgi:hypothetical protein
MQKLIIMKELLILLLLLISKLLPAQRDPQWLIPLYFRDANGDRDTVYFGYDPEASMYSDADTILGEEWIQIDTSEFNIFLVQYPNCGGGDCPILYTDTVKKVEIRNYPVGCSIGFCKGKMPITMKWVDSLLYAPSCPFPDLSPRPRARIDLNCSPQEPAYLWCGPADGDPLSLTDYPAPEISYPVMDSMFFNGSGYYTPAESIGGLTLSLVPHNSRYVGMEDNKNPTLNVFPNPFTDKLTIQYPLHKKYSMQILNLSGEILLQLYSNGEELTIDMSGVDKGFYLVIIKSTEGILIQKNIKIE